MKWCKLGELIEEATERNADGLYGESQLKGVNSQQQFCPTRANTNGIDFRQYKVVRKGDFVYNPARLDIGSISLFTEDVCIVSTLYEVFHLSEAGLKVLSPEFLLMYFSRPEFFRYVGFANWGSAREYFWLDAMLRVSVPLPPLAEQQAAVDAWQGLRKLKTENEQLAEPLMALCRSAIEGMKKQWPMVELGMFISELNDRNDEGALSAEDVRGLSTGKEIIKTLANMEGVSVLSYKKLPPQCFGYVADTSRRGDKISLGYNKDNKTFLVSSISTVFSVTKSELVPDFLYLLLCRPEFDRYARFNSWGSAREMFSFSDMCRVKIPLPPVDVQQSIVDIYRTAAEAKRIAAEADRLSREICPALIQKVVRE